MNSPKRCISLSSWLDDVGIPRRPAGTTRRGRGQRADQRWQIAGAEKQGLSLFFPGHGACMAPVMLTLAIVFLVFAIAAGVLSIVVAAAIAKVLFFAFLALFVAFIVAHYVRENRARRPFK
jgi:uncharacterized membrane protein YtjA (UPF0391 family)